MILARRDGLKNGCYSIKEQLDLVALKDAAVGNGACPSSAFDDGGNNNAPASKIVNIVENDCSLEGVITEADVKNDGMHRKFQEVQKVL